MARIRTIKPEFWKHEDLSDLPADTHMLAGALLSYADDFGYFNANPKLIRAECCPLRELLVSVPDSLRSLQEIGYIEVGNGDDGKAYGRIVSFTEHQRVSHPTDSKIAKKTIAWGVSGEAPEPLGKPSEPLAPEGKGKEQGTGKGIPSGSRQVAVGDADSMQVEDGVSRPVEPAPARNSGNGASTSLENEMATQCATTGQHGDAEFERLWDGWRWHNTPKGSKKNALAMWKQHVRKAGMDPGIVLGQAAAYCRQCLATDTNTQHIERWLKNHRWEDDHGTPPDAASMVDAALAETMRRKDEEDAANGSNGTQGGYSGTRHLGSGAQLPPASRQAEIAGTVRPDGGGDG